MLIKALLLVAIAVVVVLSLRAPAGVRHLALRRVAVMAFAVLAVLSVLFPDAWNAAAAAVGVGRGTDLLLYGLIVVFLGYMVTTYRRFRDLEGQITQLARRLALDEVATQLHPPATDADGRAEDGTAVHEPAGEPVVPVDPGTRPGPSA